MAQVAIEFVQKNETLLLSQTTSIDRKCTKLLKITTKKLIFGIVNDLFP